jgi:hypothetical protein
LPARFAIAHDIERYGARAEHEGCHDSPTPRMSSSGRPASALATLVAHSSRSRFDTSRSGAAFAWPVTDQQRGPNLPPGLSANCTSVTGKTCTRRVNQDSATAHRIVGQLGQTRKQRSYVKQWSRSSGFGGDGRHARHRANAARIS